MRWMQIQEREGDGMNYVFCGCIILAISISAVSISSDLFRIIQKLNSIEARLKEKGD